MSTFLAGLRSRFWLNVGVFVLAVLAMVVAVASALYARSSAEHLLDQRIEQRPSNEVGLDVQVNAQRGDVDPQPGAPWEVTQDDLYHLGAEAVRLVTAPQAGDFWGEPVGYLLQRGHIKVGPQLYATNLYWREGICDDIVIVEGNCPTHPDEVLVDPVEWATLSASGATHITHIVEAAVTDAKGNIELKPIKTDFSVVGTYTVPDPTGPQWFDPGRMGGDATLRPPTGTGVPQPPAAPALIADPSAFRLGADLVAGADRAIDTQRVNLAETARTQAALQAWQSTLVDLRSVRPNETPASLEEVFGTISAEQQLLSRVTMAAVVPLVVLALLLLFVLVSAAAEVRRPEVALAKLRGFSTSKVIRFALGEPGLVLAIALPVGAALAVVLSRLIAHTWLGATPLVITGQAIWAGIAVAAAAVLSAFAAVWGVVREPLSDSLSAATRKRSTSRVLLLAQGAIVMLSVAAVAQVVTSKATQSSSYVELLAPLFLALGVAVLAMVALGLVARLWTTRTSAQGKVAGFLAARRLSRRGDLVQLVLPLLLATAMTTFAVSAWKVSDDWRVSTAKAEVGAATAYYTSTPPTRMQWITEQVDPEGRYLATMVPPAPRTEGSARVALVDASRFARVVEWDSSWGSATPAEIQADLASAGAADPITFTGTELAVTFAEVAVKAKLNLPLEVWVRYQRTDIGEQQLARLGELPRAGAGEVVGFVGGCEQACTLQQLFISGSSVSVTDVSGSLTITGILANGDQPGDWRLTEPDAWRGAYPLPIEGGALVTPTSDATGLTLDIPRGQSTIVRLTTSDLSGVPSLVTTEATELLGPSGDEVSGASLLGVRTPMRIASQTVTLPFVGDEGGLSDLGPALREYGDQATSVNPTVLLAAPDTPAAMLKQVRAEGVDLTTARVAADELRTLRSDAFTLGWRVFLLVGGLTLLLAFAGVLALAIVQLRWRAYEVAALRVVGVRRPSLRRAIAFEYLALLGIAVTGGALAAGLALTLVLPSLDIGAIGTYAPAVDYSLRWWLILGVVIAVLMVVSLIALLIARRTVKLGTPASLRQMDVR